MKTISIPIMSLWLLKKGQVKKTSLEQYSRPRANGINAITIKDDDELLEAKLTTGNSQILLAVNLEKPFDLKRVKPVPWVEVLREFEELLWPMPNDEVVGMVAVNDMDANILVVSENGYGKRSSLEDYQNHQSRRKGCENYFNYR